MNLETWNRLAIARKIPHLALPWTNNPRENVSKNLKFLSVTVKRKSNITNQEKVFRVSADLQATMWEGLLSLKRPFHPLVIGISSDHNDLASIQLAGNLTYGLAKTNPNFRWAWYNTAYDFNIDSDIEHIVYYNVGPNPDRVQKVRDLLTKFPRALRVLIVPGMTAVKYFDSFLHFPLSGFFHVRARQIKSPLKPKPLPEFTLPLLEFADSAVLTELVKPFINKVEKR